MRFPNKVKSLGSSKIFYDQPTFYLATAEKLLDVCMRQLYPGRAAMIALAAVGRDLHFAEQSIHLGNR